MKKNTRLLVISVIMAAALAAVLIAVLFIPSDKNNYKLSDDNEIILFDKSEYIPEVITVSNEGGDYELMAYDYIDKSVTSQNSAQISTSLPDTAVAVAETSESELKIIYTMQDHESIPLDTSITEKLATQCSSLTVSEIVDKTGKKYEEYGLDRPRSTVKIRFSDSEIYTIEIGNSAPDQSGVYLKLVDDKNVYLAPPDEVDTFFVEKLQMFSKSITGTMEETEKLTISGTGYNEDIVLTRNNDSYYNGNYMLTKPERCYCDVENSKLIVSSISTLNAIWVTAIDVTKDELKEYGLEKPFEVVKMEGTDGSVIDVIASEKDSDGRIYLMDPKKTIIYQTYAENNAWYDARKESFLGDSVLNFNKDDIYQLTLKAGERNDEYTVERTSGVNEGYYLVEDIKVMKAGVEYDYSYFITLVDNLISLSRGDAPPKDTKGFSDIFSAKVIYRSDTDIIDTLVLMRNGSGKTIAVLNGKAQCYVDSTYADKLVEQAGAFAFNKPIEKLSDTEETPESSAASSESKNTADTSKTSADTSDKTGDTSKTSSETSEKSGDNSKTTSDTSKTSAA